MELYEFEKLNVYQASLDLAEKIYKVTKTFPADELYATVSQLRRAATSVPANIAEGKGRYHTKVYVQFLYQARGSLYEMITFIRLSQRFGYIDGDQTEDLLQHIAKVTTQLSNLINSMK